MLYYLLIIWPELSLNAKSLIPVPSNCQSAQGYEKNYSQEKKKCFVTVLTKLMQSENT